jgi:simple sugar transport system permease protein
MLDILFSEHTITTGISLATPILLCALGGAVCSKSGNFNIAMEGFMLIGAFFGVVGAYYMNSVAMGLLFAMLASVLIALLYGLFLMKFRADEIILGFGFNMLAVALTGWLLEPVFGGAGSFYNPATPSLEKIVIPFLEGIPVLRCLSGHNMIVYLSWILVLVIHFMMYKTPLGFRLRALGENPRTLGVSGLHTDRYRYLSEIIVGVLCGLAGAFLSIGNLSMFTENMTSGRGYIAVAAVGFSNGYIPITALAGLIFGLTSSAAIQLQGIGFPSQLVDMTPYVITIVIILISAFNRRKTR